MVFLVEQAVQAAAVARLEVLREHLVAVSCLFEVVVSEWDPS